MDHIFQAHLQGRAHDYSATNTDETPAVDALSRAVTALHAWYLAYVESMDPASLPERLRFVFTDGDRGQMSREEILCTSSPTAAITAAQPGK